MVLNIYDSVFTVHHSEGHKTKSERKKIDVNRINSITIKKKRKICFVTLKMCLSHAFMVLLLLRYLKLEAAEIYSIIIVMCAFFKSLFICIWIERKGFPVHFPPFALGCKCCRYVWNHHHIKFSIFWIQKRWSRHINNCTKSKMEVMNGTNSFFILSFSPGVPGFKLYCTYSLIQIETNAKCTQLRLQANYRYKSLQLRWK